MSIFKNVTSVLFASLLSLNALACSKPELSGLPDPKTAVTPQMVKAKHELTRYLKEAEAYLKCADGDRAYNVMVDEMKNHAAAFNKIVSEYKKRMQTT